MGIGGWLFGGDAGEGLPSGPATGDYQTGYLKNMLGRPAPQMDASQSNQARGQMQNLAGMLTRTASGQQAGAGEIAVNRQVNQANAAQTGAARMARGADAALAQRNAARTMADINVSGAGMAQQAAMQDQTAAQSQLGSLLGGMRAGDIGVAQGNQQAAMQQQNVQLGALAQMLGVDQATLQMALEKQRLNANDTGMFGQLLAAGGQVGAAFASRPSGG